MFEKYLQQEIYIARSAALTFLFSAATVTTPSIVYGVTLEHRVCWETIHIG